MKWISANKLSQWASERIDARSALSDLIQQLVRASVSDASAFRFPSGDNAQLPGWDGRLIASIKGTFAAFVPDQQSVWEWGVDQNPRSKAQRDWITRKENPGTGINAAENTFVFVTPHIWQSKEDWRQEKLVEGSPWKDLRVLDGVAIEQWSELCPAAAATFARENGFTPREGVDCIDEFWENYSFRFDPKLTEAVLLAGREDQSKAVLRELAKFGPISLKGDSLDEVIAFVVATIRATDPETREFLRARTLVVQSMDAAKQLAVEPNLAFIVRGDAGESAGYLSSNHPVVIPLGRETNQPGNITSLVYPTTTVMTAALRDMGLPEDRALRLPHECGRSVTILGRRIPRIGVKSPAWINDSALISAFLAGSWSRSSEADRQIVREIAGNGSYDRVEADLRPYLRLPDAPLETVGEIWAVRAPVDLYLNISHLIGAEHWARLAQVAKRVFAEIDPAYSMEPDERIYAGLRGEVLSHSQWLRDGLATTLLILAAVADQTAQVPSGGTPQRFVDEIVGGIPGLREDWRVIASLRQQLPMLMEAAPVPLFLALEHLLKGDGEKLRPIFQDAKDRPALFSDSPHSALLWALEIAAQDPQYLPRAADILAKLVRIDPGGTLSNRPEASLREIFLAWKPLTNASHELRLATLKTLTEDHPEAGWNLLLRLIPRSHETSMSSVKPRFRDAGLSEREALTWGILHEYVTEIVQRIVQLADLDAKRWVSAFDIVGSLDPRDRQLFIKAFASAIRGMDDLNRQETWQPLAALIRRHRSYPDADWTMAEEEIRPLEELLRLVEPSDRPTRDRYLFQEQLPEIPGVDIHDRWDKAEELRQEVVRDLLERKGISGVLAFAAQTEAPRFVGGAFGAVAKNADEILQAILEVDSIHMQNGLIAAASSAAYIRFGETWMLKVTDAFRSGYLSQEKIASVIQRWPNERRTWDWLETTGLDPIVVFWSKREPWGITATEDDLRFAVDSYLRANRPEFVVDALAHRAKEIATDQLLETLAAFDGRVLTDPAIMRGQTITYDLKVMFQELQNRADAPLESVALLEYKFLPILRELREPGDNSSALDGFLSGNPQFFVSVISQVFRPRSERGEPKPEYSENEQARARTSYTLLESFAKIPGREGSEINLDALDYWVGEVRGLADKADRLDISEQFIGKLLAHAPADPIDGIWPHKTIREGLEKWRSDQIELGLYIGKLNSRGVTSRGMYEGGATERVIAAAYREDASNLGSWPRARALLINLAESYERTAESEDVSVRQLRLRE